MAGPRARPRREPSSRIRTGLRREGSRTRRPLSIGSRVASSRPLWRIPQDCRRVGSRMAGEQLRVTEGKERGRRLSVEADLLIGRIASEDEGRLGGDPEISRRHAKVTRGADGWLTIEDLGSANGTFVNDERIDGPRTLDLGDVVRGGKTDRKR